MPYRSLLDYDDLVAYAGIGLIDAIEKFDVSYNVKFETFAYYRINGAVIDGLRELQNFPRETAFLRREIAPLIESLTQVLGRTPTHDELKIYFQFVSIGDRSISDILDDPLLTASVFNQQPLRNSDDNQGEDGDNSIGCIESCLCKRRKSYVPKPYEALQRIDLISKIMKILNDDIYERTVVMCYFFMSMTSNQIAKITGLSLTWVSTKKESALRKLRIAARKDPDAFREEFLA